MVDNKISKEFFGGIFHDKERNRNVKLDDFLMKFIEVMEDRCEKKEFYKEYASEIELIEMIDLFQTMVEIGIYKKNFELIQNNNELKILSAPFRIFYDISYGCNLHCKHCFTDSGNIRKNELTLDEKREFVDQCVSLGVGRISIAGGEPLCCSDLFPFLEYCNKKELGVSITTNGTMLTPEIVKRLNEYSLKTVTISLDGASKATCEFVRGGGSYNKIIEGLNNMSKYYDGNFSVKTTIMKNNIGEIEQLIQLAVEKKCSSIKFNCVRKDGRAEQNSEELVLTKKEYIETIKLIESMKEKYKSSIVIKAPLNPFCQDEYNYIHELGFGCFAGKESICVDPMGNVKPCSHFPDEFICGNIKNKKLSEIWNDSMILNTFRQFEGNEKCNKCSIYDKCRGGCRYRSFLSGNINGVDVYCYRE